MNEHDLKILKELFRVTDNIRMARDLPLTFTRRIYIHLTQSVCASLTEASNRIFNEYTGSFAEHLNDPEIQEAIKLILEDAKAFVHFLEFEYNFLRQCGASKKTANEIVFELASVKEKAKTDDSPINEFYNNLENFRNMICEGATQGANYIKDKDGAFNHLKRLKGLYGVSTVGANIAGWIGSAGVPVGYFAVSGLLGAALTNSISEIPNPLDKNLIDRDTDDDWFE